MSEGSSIPPVESQSPPPKKKPMPVWARIIFGIAGLIAIVSGILTIFGGHSGHDVAYGKDDITYYHDATHADADAVAKALQDASYFGDANNGKTVLLDKTGDSIVISFVVNPDKASDPNIQKSFHDLGVGVTKSLSGKLTTVRLVDPELNEKQSMPA